MSLLLASTGINPELWRDFVQKHRPDLTMVTPDETVDRAGIRYAMAWRHKPGTLANYPNLAAIFSLGAGVDHIFADPLLPLVPVVRVVDPGLRDRMSEWVLLHVLMHHRQQRMYDYQQYEKIWTDDSIQPAAREVRVGVMGMGVLGTDSAQKLRMLGFDVAGWSRTAKTIPDIPCFSGADGLDTFLARTEILVCLLPATPDTRGILDRTLFEKLARDGRLGGPIILNAGRGALQVETDILDCLDDGTLQAATLDVFETEPLPATSALWHHPRVTITPHNSALSTPGDVAALILRQIAAFERGEPLQNVVDRQRQY
jgi:glyoxylate/hydroxypyruvate reductase A